MLREVPPPVANPEAGEVALVVRNDRDEIVETFVLRMNTNALCALEQAMGEHVHKLGARVMNPGLQDLRALLYAALRARHPGMTANDAGDLIDRAGYEGTMTAVLEAFRLGFPAAKPGEKKGKAAEGKDPGTGPRSSPTRRKQGSVPRSSGA